MRTDYSRPKTIDNVLTPEEQKDLLEAIESYREEVIVFGLLFTGMRVGEFVHMRKDWIDFKQRIIKIPYEIKCSCKKCSRPQIRKSDGVMTRASGIWRVKTLQSARIIPMVPEVTPILKKFFKSFNSVIEMIPSGGSAYYHLKKVAKRAKIDHPVFPHALRGTFASILADQGFTLLEIKETMGWADFKMALKYIRLFGGHMRDTFDKKWKGVKEQ